MSQPIWKRTERLSLPVEAATNIPYPSLVAMNTSGNAVVPSAATDLVAGNAEASADNSSGAAGDINIEIRGGPTVLIPVNNSSGGEEVTLANDFGQACYVVDGTTVSNDSSGGTRPVAGKVGDVREGKVWIQAGPLGLPDGDLIASNNLSDVASAASSRANLDAGRYLVQVPTIDLTAADSQVYVHNGPDATLARISTVTSGATTTGGEDVTITADIEGTPVTTGVVTIAGGSALDTVDSADPTAANVISEGEILHLVVNPNSQVAAAFGHLTLEFTY